MIIDAIIRALSMAFAMGWEILWPLILGFALSGVVQAVVSHREMTAAVGSPGAADSWWPRRRWPTWVSRTRRALRIRYPQRYPSRGIAQ